MISIGWVVEYKTISGPVYSRIHFDLGDAQEEAVGAKGVTVVEVFKQVPKA